MPPELTGLDRDVLDQIFDFQVRDFSAYAVALHGKPSSTGAQQDWAIGVICKPRRGRGAVRAGLGAGLGPQRRVQDAHLTRK